MSKLKIECMYICKCGYICYIYTGICGAKLNPDNLYVTVIYSYLYEAILDSLTYLEGEELTKMMEVLEYQVLRY